MASKNEIVNFALMLIGQSPIVDGEESVSSTYVDVSYDMTRKVFLTLHHWNAAKKTAVLNVPNVNEDSLYGYEYNLPGDFLTMVEVLNNTSGQTDFNDYRIYGDKILTNLGDLYITYIYDMMDVQGFTPGMAKAFAANLAMELCGKIPGTAAKLSEVSARFTDYLNYATQDSNNNSFISYSNNDWHIARLT